VFAGSSTTMAGEVQSNLKDNLSTASARSKGFYKCVFCITKATSCFCEQNRQN
jgi:hypothetical protein